MDHPHYTLNVHVCLYGKLNLFCLFTEETIIVVQAKPPPKPKLHSCRFCEKRFIAPSHVSRHERIHTGEKPYICETCGRGFTTSDHMMRHERTHTGVKLYECKYCGKCFTQNHTLLTHEARHMEAQ